MNVVDTVAFNTAGSQTLLFELATVTRAAQQIRMSAPQGEASPAVMVEPGIFPAGCTMTGFAFFTILSPVFVITAMAGDAIHTDVFIKQFSAMTSVTGNIPVPASQRVIGTPVMIKHDLFPSGLMMTVIAFPAVSPGMDIIQYMTVHAVGRRGPVLLARVTAVAGHVHMSAPQPVICFIVVEFLLFPAT
jgi:hypothetical protein